MDERVIYREKTPYAPWVRILVWGVLLGTALAVGLGTGDAWPGLGPYLTALGLVSLAWAFEVLLGGVLIELRRRDLRVGLGNATIFKTTILYDEIASLRSVTYRPLREFGGWGLRGAGSKQAWTARGNQAVVLTMRDDREIYLGSDHPRRLEERIRTTAGDRLGARAGGAGA